MSTSSAPQRAAALETRQLRKAFGAFVVSNDINFRLEPGARHALIGPNGAGKTTFVNLVSGALNPTSGSIHLNGLDVTAEPQARRVKRGLIRTFQINQLFRKLTVLENVSLAISERDDLATNMLRPAGKNRAAIDEAYGLLERVGLAPDALRTINDLPYGRQRMVEIAVALGLKPSVLLLDEPAAGVPTGEVGIIIDLIHQLPSDIAIMLIEHDMDIVFRVAKRITVLVEGATLVEGEPAEIAANPKVREVYLGERSAK
jgi:branched-chain amino acid transport system ATP-binding protein